MKTAYYQKSIFIILYMGFLFLSVVNASQFHFQLENDVIFGEDGNYSNGMIFGWESDAIHYTPSTALSIHNWQQALLFSQTKSEQAWGLKVSQRMWTPNEIKIEEAQPYDRPYAGFLAFEQHAALYSSDIAQKTWLAIGVIGPASGTEQLQDVVHKITGSSTPKGWQHQIENKATIQLGYEIDYLLLRDIAPLSSQWEISTFSHNTLGNFRSNINVGFTFRWGTNLDQTFGRLSSHFGHAGNLISKAQAHSLLFFTRVQAGYRFNDLTIDGKLPYKSEVELNPQQASAAAGISYYFSDVAITWSFNIYNKEYLTDKNNWHGYGLLQFVWSL
jgi:hypothetical protein